MPDGKTVVLGLVTTKRPRLESREEILRRIDAASRFIARERLALSPQCGFSTSVVGNRITVEDQRRKLALVVETARAAWG